MLTSAHRLLRRRRREVLTVLAVLATAMATLGAHAALMNGGLGDHAVGGASAICVAIGGALAIAAGAGSAMRRPAGRLLWRVSPFHMPVSAFVPCPTCPLVRAGPSLTLLQVLRR